MHPLAPNLVDISDEELHSKRTNLQNKLNFAYKMGHSELVEQLHLLLDDYNVEVEKRNQKLLSQNANLIDKIDITK